MEIKALARHVHASAQTPPQSAAFDLFRVDWEEIVTLMLHTKATKSAPKGACWMCSGGRINWRVLPNSVSTLFFLLVLLPYPRPLTSSDFFCPQLVTMSYANGGGANPGASSSGSSSRSKRELIDRVKYPNPIPVPPYPPKLVKIPTEPSRYANPHFADRLASQQPIPVVVDVHAGMPIDLANFKICGKAIYPKL